MKHGQWHSIGTWVVKDERGRLHFADGQSQGWPTKAEAEQVAYDLETATGYSCAVYPLQTR